MIRPTPPNYVKMHPLRKARKPVVAVTTIHDPDAVWIDQLLAEYDRLGWDVAWHFNNLSTVHRDRLARFPGTLGYSLAEPSPHPYTDYDYSWPLLLAQDAGAEWVCVHNPDETLEPRAPEMLAGMLVRPAIYICRWYNVWEVLPDGRLRIRADKPFIGHKSRFYPVKKEWQVEMRRGVSSPYYVGERQTLGNNGKFPPAVWADLRIIHWGFSTPELRQRHWQQWKGTPLTGKVCSPYWDSLIDPAVLAKAEFKVFDPEQTHEQFVAAPAAA